MSMLFINRIRFKRISEPILILIARVTRRGISVVHGTPARRSRAESEAACLFDHPADRRI